MIDDQELIQRLTEIALGYLDYDDSHPDVGMGMHPGEAIKYAQRDIVCEAARWNSMEALGLDQTRFDSVQDRVYAAVRQARRR